MPGSVIKWYHKKWFVVLMLIVFFPIGLVLLWSSPVTKISGRIVWSLICVVGLMVSFSAGKSPTPATDTASAASPTAPGGKPAAAPKDEYPFKLNDKASGKVYQGKIASNVGVAITGVTTSKSVGDNEFLKQTASSGAVYVLVNIGVTNEQKDAITMDGNLFKLLADGREYSHSSEATIAGDTKTNFFLKQINPGLTAIGTVAFEVPEGINIDGATLQFSGGFTGKKDTLPLKAMPQ